MSRVIEIPRRVTTVRPADGLLRTTQVFSASGESVGAFRRMVREQLGANSGTAVQIASELAANSVGHATPHNTPQTFLGGVELWPDRRTRIFTADNSKDLPVINVGGENWATRERGRGMAMVAILSEEWGATAEVPDWIKERYQPAQKIVYANTVVPPEDT